MGEWRSVADINHDWTMKEAAVICRQLDCGSAVSVEYQLVYGRKTWKITPACINSGSALRDCTQYLYTHHGVRLNCSGESVVTSSLMLRLPLFQEGTMT